MKRHYFDDLEIEVLSERSFAKRLKIDEQISVPEVSFTTFKCQTDKKEKYAEPEQWLKDTGFVNSEPKFDSLNLTLRELHHQREERKLLRKSEGPLTSLVIPDQIENRGPENQAIFYPYGTASTDFPVVKDSWANCLRKQQQFQRDYEMRCRFELQSDSNHSEKSGAEFSRQFSVAECDLRRPCPRYQHRESFVIPYSPPHQESWNSTRGLSVFPTCEDQMEVD
jgi:hypothetical protein